MCSFGPNRHGQFAPRANLASGACGGDRATASCLPGLGEARCRTAGRGARGAEVGYRVRNDDRCDARTRIVYATPGIVLQDHYWLSWNNTAVRHAVLPDGCVDVVIECLEGDARCWAFGTTTQRRQLEVRPGAHYLGVRFRAGQGRHVLSVAAGELTDTRLPASEGTRLPLERVVEALQRASLPTREPFEAFERALWAYLERQPPAETVLDAALRLVDERGSQVRVGELAAQLGISCDSKSRCPRPGNKPRASQLTELRTAEFCGAHWLARASLRGALQQVTGRRSAPRSPIEPLDLAGAGRSRWCTERPPSSSSGPEQVTTVKGSCQKFTGT